jgi:structural maintenance of chromosome 1
LLRYPKLESAHHRLQKKIEELASVVNAAEDKIFSGFCRKIKVKDIREYEERQLKASQDESEARLRFDTQIARLTHQCVLSHHLADLLCW